jgi:hypothetical protein
VRQCAFCGKDAETEEHVIPKWLQKHFDLFDQRLALWNGTTIPYRQTVMPACLACNRDRFAPLEMRVRDGRASRRDYYLWALKITYGLGHRDTSLLLDRSRPQAGPLLPDEIAKDIEELARHAFQGVDRTEFRFSPEPFGSVILMDTDSDEFVFIDVPRPFRAVAIALPNKKHLVVLPGDRGVIATMYGSRRFKKRMQLEFPSVDGQLQLALKVFGMLITRSHLAIPRTILLKENGIFAARVPRNLPTVYQPREVYRGIADMLHLPHALADEAHSRHASGYASIESLRWR